MFTSTTISVFEDLYPQLSCYIAINCFAGDDGYCNNFLIIFGFQLLESGNMNSLAYFLLLLIKFRDPWEDSSLSYMDTRNHHFLRMWKYEIKSSMFPI